MWVILMAAACRPSADGTGDDSGAHLEETVDYDPGLEAVDGSAASYGAADVEAALPELIDDLHGMNSGPAFEVYDALLAEQDEDCPTYPEVTPALHWQQYPPCTSTGGVTYYGDAYTNSSDHSDSTTVVNFINLLARLDRDDGASFVCDCATSESRVRGDGDTVVGELIVEGGFSWTGSEAAGTWLGEGWNPEVEVDSVSDGATGARTFEVTASWYTMATPFMAIQVSDVSLSVDADGAGEVAEGGRISLRDESGDWYQLDLDLPGEADDGLDACGEVLWHNEDLGKACVDLSPLMDWEVVPW